MDNRQNVIGKASSPEQNADNTYDEDKQLFLTFDLVIWAFSPYRPSCTAPLLGTIRQRGQKTLSRKHFTVGSKTIYAPSFLKEESGFHKTQIIHKKTNAICRDLLKNYQISVIY